MRKEEIEKLKASLESLTEDYLTKDILNRQKLGVKEFIELVMETLMNSERKVFLSEEEDNKANGYYGRTLNAGSFKIDLNVPRDRKGKFRPKTLPEPYRRVNEDYVNLLMSLVANGYSESKIESTLNNLGLDYSKQHMEIIKQDLLERLNDFKTRELPSDIAIL